MTGKMGKRILNYDLDKVMDITKGSTFLPAHKSGGSHEYQAKDGDASCNLHELGTRETWYSIINFHLLSLSTSSGIEAGPE
mmetsp:Transcript_12705/g.26774  ORF Transcript_12705/g.26774 Transcript_12705/m.26774 type:complete len:81 (+) Transcript_12705:1522-1764(+)